jgi:hypothetical protein
MRRHPRVRITHISPLAGRVASPGSARHYDRAMPRIWVVTMAILCASLLASMVIAIAKLT